MTEMQIVSLFLAPMQLTYIVLWIYDRIEEFRIAKKTTATCKKSEALISMDTPNNKVYINFNKKYKFSTVGDRTEFICEATGKSMGYFVAINK